MDVEALPHIVLLVLCELAVGSVWALGALQVRGEVAWSFVKFAAWMAAAFAALALAVALQAPPRLDDYPLDGALMGPARALLASFLALVGAYALAALGERRGACAVLGALASLAGAGALACLAWVFRLPAWGYVGVLMALATGALVAGGAVMGMTLGHWYLVTPRLSERPLKELTLVLVGALVLQGLVTGLGLALPHQSLSGGPQGGEPFLWLKVSGGTALPLALSYMAYESTAVRAMQSATGLLYIVMALVIAGEVVGKAFLLSQGMAL